jgi:RimJ/RimL family protein N-acetyltransferase
MLTGDRVLLRAIERADLPRLWEQDNDLEVEHRATDARPLPTSLAAMEARFDARAAQPETDLVRFVIEVDGVVIGECGLHYFDQYSQQCHLGISIRRDRWGQGYGQDAVRTLLRYAFGPLNFRKVSLEVLADDARAVGAYRKAGFVEEGRLRAHAWHDGAYRDVLRMATFRS